MMLNNEEFARLERTRVTMERTKVRSKVSPLQLAMEHMEFMYHQQHQLLKINQRLNELYGQSWCYKVRRAYNLSLHKIVRAWKRVRGVKPIAP